MDSRITPSVLAVLLRYEPDTGHLYWLTRPRVFFRTDGEHHRWNGRYAGKRAFTINSNGYRDGMIFRKMYRAHQVAWALMMEEWPAADIDHINGDRDDNRWENLRVVTRSENCRNTKMRANNKSGVIGVAALRGRWRAYIRDGDKNLHLGVFDTIAQAAKARSRAADRLGYHANHGRAN